MERLLPLWGACCALVFGAIATAGPLTPPGAPAPTMKTLDAVEPSIPVGPLTTPGDVDALFVIDTPGAYHLAADIDGQNGRHGVQIMASDVTLDLRGFTLRGVAGSLDGVRVGETAGPLFDDIVIRNGRATGWGGSGVRADRADRSTVSRMSVRSNGAYGIIAGVGARIFDCAAEGSALTNIAVAAESIVSRSLAIEGDAEGFTGAAATVFESCVAFLNGADGFRPGANAIVRNCIASGNVGDGFDAGSRVRFEGCSSIFDGGRGIVAGVDSVAQSSLVTGAGDTGVLLGARGVARECSVVTPGGAGIVIGDAGRAIDCAVTGASGAGVSGTLGVLVRGCTIRSVSVGVSVDAGSRVEDCLITLAAEDGVRVTSHCTVRGNTIDDCGDAQGFDGAAVRASGDANRIEGNSATRCDDGFHLDGTANLVIGNSAIEIAMNGFVNPAGNIVGPILTGATITSSPAPNANFAP